MADGAEPQGGGPAVFDRLVNVAKELFDGEIVYDGPPIPGPTIKDRLATGAIEGASHTVTPPLLADDGRRAVVLRMGENLGWREFEYKPRHSITKGEENWRKFAATAGDAEIDTALRALETT